ncbi:MAG: hypothetical protein D6771_05905, partial [Zetaproteobacteria bacterium]
MKSVRVHVPVDLVGGDVSPRRVAKNEILRALSERRVPPPVDALDEVVSTVIYFSREQLAAMRDVAASAGIGVREWIERVLWDAASRVERRGDVSAPDWMRPEQARLYVALVKALRNGRIALAQAGTGTGKTRALLAAAEDALDRGHARRVVIAVPSVHLLAHVAREATAMGVRGLRLMLGSMQFVSEVHLREALSELPREEADRLHHWLDEGARPVSDVARTLARFARVRYLAVDATQLAPSLRGALLDALLLDAEDDPSD